MKFADFRNMLKSYFGNVTDPWPMIQSAYKDVVSKIRLHQQGFDVVITGAAGFDGFNHVHEFITGSVVSEICFKEIASILGISLSGELIDKEYTASPAAVRDWLTDFDSVDFVADENYMWIGSDLVPLDREVSRIEITGYPFPYFCYTVNGPAIDRHKYSISLMIDEYGEDNLIIDDLIGVMTALKTQMLYLVSNSNVAEASTVEHYYTQMLNLYNESRAQFFEHGFDSLTEQKGKAI